MYAKLPGDELSIHLRLLGRGQPAGLLELIGGLAGVAARVDRVEDTRLARTSATATTSPTAAWS